MSAGSSTTKLDLARRRLTARTVYRDVLTRDQSACHRRLVNSGLTVEARALIEQAERFFLAAHQAIDRMNEFELNAFERAMAVDSAPGLHQVVAAVLLRNERELLHRRIEAPLVSLSAVVD